MEDEVKLVTELVPLGEKSTQQHYRPSTSSSAHVEQVTVTYLALVETRIRVPSSAFTAKSPMKKHQAKTKASPSYAGNRPQIEALADATLANEDNYGRVGLDVIRAKVAELTEKIETCLSRRKGGSPARSQGRSPARTEGRSPARSQGRSPARSQGGSPARSEGGMKSKWGNSRLDNLGYDEGTSTPKAGPSTAADDDEDFVGPYYPKSNYRRPLTPSPERPGESERDRKLRQWIEHPKKLFRRHLEKRAILREMEEKKSPLRKMPKAVKEMLKEEKKTIRRTIAEGKLRSMDIVLMEGGRRERKKLFKKMFK